MSKKRKKKNYIPTVLIVIFILIALCTYEGVVLLSKPSNSDKLKQDKKDNQT